MYKPKFAAPRRPFPILSLLTLTITLTALAGSTLALLTQTPQPVENRFFLASGPTPEIEENFDGTVKQNVTVKNTGDIPCYLRAAVIITLRGEDGSVLAQAPQAGVDYSIQYAQDTGWFQGEDGFWYYRYPVSPGGITQALIESCTALQAGSLEVTIVSQAIQARPAEAVETAWGMTVTDGQLGGVA